MKISLHLPQAIYEIGSRQQQEDTIYPVAGAAAVGSRVFIVCDGMGGHEHGEVASVAVTQGLSAAAEAMMDSKEQMSDEHFKQVLACAYDALDQADTWQEGKMGTTMTFLSFGRQGCLAAHIGDSRIYHLRPSDADQPVRYRSRDDSLVQILYENGELSYYEMATSPRRNIIMKVMLPLQKHRTEATLVHIADVRVGDYFYLCSDGMLERMDDEELLQLLRESSSCEEAAAELLRRTASNSDNHSAYLIEIKDVEHESGDKLLVDDEAEACRKNKALNDDYKHQAWRIKPIPPADEPHSRSRKALGNKFVEWLKRL